MPQPYISPESGNWRFHSTLTILTRVFRCVSSTAFMEDQPPRYSMLEAAGWPDGSWSPDGSNVNGVTERNLCCDKGQC